MPINKTEPRGQSELKNCVIYTRVSSIRQTKDGDGLASQETRCREYARSRGYKVLEVFKDVISGSTLNREGMTNLLNFLSNVSSPETVVVIDDISRLARNLTSHLELRTMLQSAGGKLESPTMEFGEDSDSVLVENLLASVSDHQRRKNREQVYNRTRARVMNGYYTFYAPMGYRYEKQEKGGKVLVRDEPVASILEEALKGFATGRFQTQTEVKRFLDASPEFPKDLNGKEVRFQRVNDLLNRLIYSGKLEVKKWGIPLTEGVHEGLISYAQHLRIKERLKEQAIAPARKDIAKDFPLRGFVVCDNCGKAYTAGWSQSKTKVKYPYYLCRTKGCASYGKSIRKEKIEGEFEELLENMQPAEATLELAERVFRDAWESHTKHCQKGKAKLIKQAKKIDKEIAKLLSRIVDTENNTIIEAYELRITELQSEQALLEERAAGPSENLLSFDEMFELCAAVLSNPCKIWKNSDLSMQKALLRLVFAQPLAYCREQGVRTPETTFPFKVLRYLGTSDCKMVRVKSTELAVPRRSTTAQNF